MRLDQYVTTKKAAEMLGVTQDHITRLLTGEKIKGIKLGHESLVYVPSLEKYRGTKSKRGRPPSGTPQLQKANMNGRG